MVLSGQKFTRRNRCRFASASGGEGAIFPVLGADLSRSQEGRRGFNHWTAGKRDARCAHFGLSEKISRHQGRIAEYGR